MLLRDLMFGLPSVLSLSAFDCRAVLPYAMQYERLYVNREGGGGMAALLGGGLRGLQR